MNTVNFKFNNGEKVRDMVSGMEGIIDSSCLCLNGCIRYTVQPKVKKGEATKPDSWWFDEQQLELVSRGISKKVEPKYTGGPSTRVPSDKM